jgi:hypothetical protein
MTPSNDNKRESGSSPLGAAGLIALVVMAGFLAAAIAYAIHSWDAMSGTSISIAGWIFMGLGIVFTLGLGAGLMGLVFYSSRKNFDQ